MKIRPIQDTDVSIVKSILDVSPQAAQWALRDLMQPVWPQTGIWVAEENGEAIGMIAARTAGGEAEILNLAVAPVWRRRGLGRQLVEMAIAAVQAEGAGKVFLEVRESNIEARELYTGLQFAESGRRRGYYTDPVEDALVLSRTLES